MSEATIRLACLGLGIILGMAFSVSALSHLAWRLVKKHE